MVCYLKIIALIAAIEANFSVDIKEHLYCPGDTVVLKCPVSNFNRSTWLFNTAPLVQQGKINNKLHQASRLCITNSDDTGHYLQLKNTTVSDVGIYTCLQGWNSTKVIRYELKVHPICNQGEDKNKDTLNSTISSLTTVSSLEINKTFETDIKTKDDFEVTPILWYIISSGTLTVIVLFMLCLYSCKHYNGLTIIF